MSVIAAPREPSVRSHKLQAIARVMAAVCGGWAITWSFVTLGIALLLRSAMAYADAQTLVYLLAFGVYLSVFLWCFAAASVMRVWLVLVGGSAVMTTLAWWLVLPAA